MRQIFGMGQVLLWCANALSGGALHIGGPGERCLRIMDID
jgi:hypothetical protein